MIKPHGSQELNPLYVADSAARAALAEEHARLFVDDKRRAFRAGAVSERGHLTDE